jgi:hypothetical protein
MPEYKDVYDPETGETRQEEMTGAELAAYLAQRAVVQPPHPPKPDFGSDDTPAEQIADGVANLRAFLALPNPTQAQMLAALKLVIRGLLFLLKRAV